MSLRSSLKPFRKIIAAAALVLPITSIIPAQAAPWSGNRSNFASPLFANVWRNADLAVQQGQTTRSWTWGPSPWFDYREVYKQSPDGKRLVQYYDKARMEINDPAKVSGPLNGVTNGLLPVEMISGRVKLGDGVGPDENQQSAPAALPVAGDTGPNAVIHPDTPTYESFRTVATTDNGYKDANKVGQRVGTTLRQDGQTGFRQDLADQPGTDIVAYETVTGHNVPRVFNDFRNSGPVPAIVAFGYPITDPYWIKAKVGGQDKDIMIQVFERRTVTYTPSNPAAFRVEMGNVGQHYFMWRYSVLGQPWSSPDPQWPIAFASKTDNNAFDMYLSETPTSSPQRVLTSNALPYSMRRSWVTGENKNPLIYGDLTNANGKRQIFTMSPGSRQPNVLSNNTSNDYQPAVSADSKQVVFVSDRDGNAELYLLVEGQEQGVPQAVALTQTTGCSNEHPSWSPDGIAIVFESNCLNGNWEIYRGIVSYTLQGNAQITVSKLISPAQAQQLTNNNTDDRWPRVSPDGTKVAFFAIRDGNTEIYTMGGDGSQQTRITNSASRDEAPTWSPDGRQIVFNSNRDGDHELYIMNADGGNVVQLTNNGVDDGFAVWGQ